MFAWRGGGAERHPGCWPQLYPCRKL